MASDPDPRPSTLDADTSRFTAALLGAAERFGADLSDRVGAAVSVAAGDPARGSAGGILPQIGEVVVALERAVTGAAGGPLLALCSGDDAAWLAAVAAGAPETAAEKRAAGFDPDQHRDPVGKVLDGCLQTAAAVLGDEIEVALEEPVGQPKVFALEKDLNRAVSFLGEGDLRAARLLVSAGEAGGAAVWILARSALAEALEVEPPPDRQGPGPAGGVQGLLHVSVPVIVTLAEKKMSVDEILGLAIGQVIAFEKSCDEFLELLVNNRCIGRGEVVKVGDKFGLRIVEIGDVKETLLKLGRSGPISPG